MYAAEPQYNDIPGLTDIILLLPWHIVKPGFHCNDKYHSSF